MILVRELYLVNDNEKTIMLTIGINTTEAIKYVKQNNITSLIDVIGNQIA